MTLKIKKFTGEFPALARAGRQESEETRALKQAMENANGTDEVLELHGKNEEDRDRLIRKIRTLGTKTGVSVSVRPMDNKTGVLFKVNGPVKPRKNKAVPSKATSSASSAGGGRRAR